MGIFSRKSRTPIPEFTGLQIQTAVNVLPIPLVYGSPRIPANLIYANGFRLVKSSTSGGGKGLLSAGKQPTQNTIFATFIMALGEGLFQNLVEVFENQAVYTSNDPPSGRQFTLFLGSDTQAPWSYITSNWPADAFGYKDTAYLGFPDNTLDSSGTIPFLNFVFRAIFAGTSPLNLFAAPDTNQYFLDADPGQVVLDFLTNARYGVGFPSQYIDTSTLLTSANGFVSGVGDAALGTYCQAVGMEWSVALNNAESASSILDRWMKNLVVAPVWTGAILRFIPYWDSYNDDNPNWSSLALIGMKYFQPFVTPLFDLGDDDFQQTGEGEDPLVVTRIDVADVKNVVRLNFMDRDNQFNSNVAEAKDETSVDLFGPRVDSMGTANEFSHKNYAQQAAQTQLQRNISVRNTFAFKLSWRWCILDPMDIVTLTDANLGLDHFPVRIRSIEEDDKFILSIIAEEFPPDSATATLYPSQSNTSPTLSTNVVPGAVNTPFIFEPTAAMLAAQGTMGPQIVVGASAGPAGTFDPNWGGCIVSASNDGVTYVEQGRLNGPSRQGVTTANLAAYGGANPDNTNTLSVDLSESGGDLTTVTSAQAAAGLSLCAIIDSGGNLELLSYTTATLTGPNAYNLTGLYRGLYNTSPASHLSGAQFLRVDDAVLSAPTPSAFVGLTIHLKLQSFNIFGQSIQDISTCTAYPYTVTGAGTSAVTFPFSGSEAGTMAANQVIYNYTFTSTTTFEVGFAGSAAVAQTGATLLTHLRVQKNGAAIGAGATINFAAGGASPQNATFTLAAPVTFNPGDVMTILAPAVPDATLAGVSWTLLGTLP
jgi:Putative phage tail protein